MLFPTEFSSFFDTSHATQKKYVAKMNIKFAPRTDYTNKENENLLYLYITSQGQKKTISLDLFVPLQLWDKKKQRIATRNISPEHSDLNLILDNIQRKITEIKVIYRLNEQPLTMERFIEEFKSNFSRVDFIAFADEICNREDGIVAKRTNQKRRSVIEKIKHYRSCVLFSDLTIEWIEGYKKFWMNSKVIDGKKVKGNNLSTIGSDIKCMKKWLKIAKNYGIRINVNLDEIKVYRTRSTREYLNKEELKKIYEYYFSSFITPRYQLTLGYFLFGCVTSLRISDIKQLKREDILSDRRELKYKVTKTKKHLLTKLNESAVKITEHSDFLFELWKSEQKINKDLKDIMAMLGIDKRITFHCSRHTFATNYLRLDGNVQTLQKILGHSSINETMIYVHIVDQEKEESIYIMDQLFQ